MIVSPRRSANSSRAVMSIARPYKWTAIMARVRRYQALHRIDIEMESHRVHVAEYRPGSYIADRLRRREERVRRHYHVIAGGNPCRFQGEFQGGRSGAHANRIFASNKPGKFLFE